jgi:hypothetical protein
MYKAMAAIGALALATALMACGGGAAGETCIPFKTCPKGGTMSSCCKPNSAGGDTCRYKLSDGTSVQCAGNPCNTSEAAQANAWCSTH